MSATNNHKRGVTFARNDFPNFDLSYLVDDTEDPNEITVFPSVKDLDISTHWITIDAAHAVSLDKVP